MGAMRRVIKNPNVTAGLKCPPEMCPTAEAMTAITNPCANATPTRPEPVMIAPAPTNVSAKAPTSSAALRRKTSPSTPAEGRVTAGRLLHVQSASSATHRQKMRRADADAHVRIEELTREAKRVRKEADVYARDIRQAVDSYGTQARREAEEEARALVDNAEEQARSVREAAEAMAEQIQADAHRRHETLQREAKALEERRQRVLDGLRDLAAQLQDALVEPSRREDDSLVDALDVERRR